MHTYGSILMFIAEMILEGTRDQRYSELTELLNLKYKDCGFVNALVEYLSFRDFRKLSFSDNDQTLVHSFRIRQLDIRSQSPYFRHPEELHVACRFTMIRYNMVVNAGGPFPRLKGHVCFASFAYRMGNNPRKNNFHCAHSLSFRPVVAIRFQSHFAAVVMSPCC